MRILLALSCVVGLSLAGCSGPADGGPGTDSTVLEIDTGTGGEGSGATGTGGTEPADNEEVESDTGAGGASY